jgi:hypothetical protein
MSQAVTFRASRARFVAVCDKTRTVHQEQNRFLFQYTKILSLGASTIGGRKFLPLPPNIGVSKSAHV